MNYCFFIVVEKKDQRKHFKEGTFIWRPSLRVPFRSWWGSCGERKARQLVALQCTTWKQRSKCWCSGNTLTLTPPWNLVHEIGPLTLPSSVKSFWKHPDTCFHGDSKPCQVENQDLTEGILLGSAYILVPCVQFFLQSGSSGYASLLSFTRPANVCGMLLCL